MEQERQRQLSEEELQLQAQATQQAVLESVARSASWGMLLAFVEDQTKQRMNWIMLEPIKSMEDAAEHNFKRGECAGLNLVIKFLENQLGVTRDAVELYKQALSEKGEE